MNIFDPAHRWRAQFPTAAAILDDIEVYKRAESREQHDAYKLYFRAKQQTLHAAMMRAATEESPLPLASWEERLHHGVAYADS